MKKLLTPLMVGMALNGLSAPVAAKSTIGGIVFLNTYYQDESAERAGGNDDVSKSVVKIPDNSRIRVRWNNEDNVAMYTELGIGSDVSLRHAWGSWDMNEEWQILAGQTSTPFAPLDPEVAMVNNSGQSVGNVKPKRQAQVRMTYKFLNRQGAFAVAIADPNGGDDVPDIPSGNSLGDKDSKVPRIDIGAAYRAFNWQIFPGAFYQKQTYTNLATSGSDDDITTWGASLGAKTAFGPIVLSAEIGAGQNWGNSRMSLSGSPAGDNAGAAAYVANGVTKLADTDNLAYWVDAGYRFTAGQLQGSAHLVYGAMNSEGDGPSGSAGDTDYESTMLGVSVPIDVPWIARGFRFRPEVFYFDYGNNKVGGVKTDGGDETIAGVQLQFTF